MCVFFFKINKIWKNARNHNTVNPMRREAESAKFRERSGRDLPVSNRNF